MTAEEAPPSEGDAYIWDQSVPLPQDALRKWQEVAQGIDKSQTVVWKNAVQSLDWTNRYLNTHEEARHFMERYMKPVISILVEQQPAKIGQHERNCVEESLDLATHIVAKDIRIQLKRKGECVVLDVLQLIFNKKKAYYKGTKGNWNSHLSGLPEVRLQLIERFRTEHGFSSIAEYLSKRVNTPQFPSIEILHQILSALCDIVPNFSSLPTERKAGAKEVEDDAILVAQAAIDFISLCSDDRLKKQPHEILSCTREDLQKLFDRLVITRRKETYAFYDFWRALTLKLITSQSLPLKLFGWDQVSDLIVASARYRPPARSFVASGAGCSFVNGVYWFVGTTTEDGYAVPGAEVSYVRRIPVAEKDGGGKCLTLFRCTMRSQQKWWFLSEADEEQPGTDRDIDYYQHKSKEHEEREPPPDHWITCRNAGVDPPPKLRGDGLMVPPDEEYNTLDHQLAKWAIENGIVELVLGDSLHREIVARSTPLIKFLASMCERDAVTDKSKGTMKLNIYCLQDSHLILAWKTCTSKADAAVSSELYQLLVSILPSLPNEMAVTLLTHVQMSLRGSTEKRDYLPEVAEFCSALAASAPVDAKTGQPLGMHGISDRVRHEILHLMWSLLIHPDASSLKSYDHLKRYVANELRVEPTGAENRKFFLEACTTRLSTNANRKPGSGPVDELHVLRTVKLTQFVLIACPREQTVLFVTDKEGALPLLLFNELIAYMSRRNSDISMSPIQKRTGAGEMKHDVVAALSERLRILRYAYGISDQVMMSSSQLQHLWQLCSIPSDREELMIFIASASGSGPSSNATVLGLAEPHPVLPQPNKAQQSLANDSLGAAFPDSVRTSAFLELFCSTSVNWGELGEGAYRSFQVMFKKLRQSPEAMMATSGPSLDALWRICLNAGDDSVASQAMKDLLAVYAAMASVSRSQNAWSDERMSPNSDTMRIDSGEEDFGNRIFQCLVEVKKGLEAGTGSSERSAERCLRILNAAVGHDGSSGLSVTSSVLDSLSSVSSLDSLTKALASLPHGKRGQSCYRRIGIMAKRTNPNSHSMHGPVALPGQLSPGGKENVNMGSSKQPTTLRFSLDVHPLETLASVKEKVAEHCNCPLSSVRSVSVSGRLAGIASRAQGHDSSQLSLNVVPDDSIVEQMGIVNGCEMVFVLADRHTAITSNVANTKKSTDSVSAINVSEMFTSGGEFADRLFDTLLGVLELLPWRDTEEQGQQLIDSHELVWDLLLAMPTNGGILERVRNTARVPIDTAGDDDAMKVDTPFERWSDLLDRTSFHHSVYLMQVIDSFLQPAPEVLSLLPTEKRLECREAMLQAASTFRLAFIASGGFDAVVRWFSGPIQGRTQKQSERRMGNAVALRLLKCCLFGDGQSVVSADRVVPSLLDDAGKQLLESLFNVRGLLTSLTAMIVRDDGISTATITDVLQFLWLLFGSARTTEVFVSLPDSLGENFLVTLLLWEEGPEALRASTSFGSSSKIRKDTHDLILKIPSLARHALPWLVSAMDEIEVTSDATTEYFDVLRSLVEAEDDDNNASTLSVRASGADLHSLGTAVCSKLASCRRPSNDSALVDFSTGVLCGCLKLIRAIIENGGGDALTTGTSLLLEKLSIDRWSEQGSSSSSGVLQRVSSSFRGKPRSDDTVLIDLMGAIFDGFLSPGGSSSVVAICCDKESRSLGFDAVAASARSCQGRDGYAALVNRVKGIVNSAVPHLRHRWNQNGGGDEGHSRSLRNTAKYSGLRNQGCTCYMNSVLQQLFMTTDLRRAMCAAPLPTRLRTSGGTYAKGAELVGKKISAQWDNGISYDAVVEGFDSSTGMHSIRYCPMQVATVGGAVHQQVHPEDVAAMPPEMLEEFFLSEGRPGKETGVFEIVEEGSAVDAGENTNEMCHSDPGDIDEFKETIDEVASRHLLEEVQRTFIHLDEGSRGRCFDPRALVEACTCLKLEFDVWQQNDASEFAMKLLDRMEIALKRWAPEQFRYLDHTFGLKQTKQKVCKECGLKTNREENLMNIDCQIRGKNDIHEALSTMCEVEYMEGNNKVFCDRCKKNTDTVLKTAISALPDMLILSLKRFDLDYNTFETVKLNSRCEFGETLNMKRYTLEGVEALEKAGLAAETNDAIPMDMDEDNSESLPIDPLSSLPDEDYEYKLAGVLVHAGVAQGGHYYSFIKDRSPGIDSDKWYRFDDEDVTPFDPSSIEVECFGGKVKKETKWPNGQVHTVESEQFANALMLFYEKVTPAKKAENEAEDGKKQVMPPHFEKASGYDVFEPDVRRSNATHRWQTFLFDSEFQSFLRGLLGICHRTSTGKDRVAISPKSSPKQRIDSSWEGPVVEMLLSFFFDVLLYSAQKESVNDWVGMLCEILVRDRELAKRFVHELAERTRAVSSNWLRTYLADCPERDARFAAVRVFSAGIQSFSAFSNEQDSLRKWATAWKSQANELPHGRAYPVELEGRWQELELLTGIGSGRASAVGIILSFLARLLEAAPRTWRYNSDLFFLIRELANARPEYGGIFLREAMLAAEFPARLICLVCRDRTQSLLRTAFPGASVSFAAADTQSRAETNPSSHLMPMGSGQLMGASDRNARSAASCCPGGPDFLILFEAFGSLLGVKGVMLAPLVCEAEETVRGRQRFVLTKRAGDALTLIFQESCSVPEAGMGQREIELYLKRTGVNSASVPPQKIIDILAKYTAEGSGSKGSNLLNVDGFLAYYRDTAQSNEQRVRLDLHAFGFRPDLSRRSRTSRVYSLDGSDNFREAVESVAIDTAERQKESSPTGFDPYSHLVRAGLQSFQFFFYAYSASEPIAEHILAACVYDRGDTILALIVSTLKALYRAPNSWVPTNETWNATLMVLKTVASVPDRLQEDRIAMIMECDVKPHQNCDHGVGLLVAPKAFSNTRSSQHYSSEIMYAYDRYVEAIRELSNIQEVSRWLQENRPLWAWMERDLFQRSDELSTRHPARVDYSRRDEDNSAVPINDNNPHSDSDMPLHSDEEEEDDFEDMGPFRENDRVLVEGAGLDAVNGLYKRVGTFENVGKYCMIAFWQGQNHEFSLFRCNTSNNTKHWYISIVPMGVQPGTSTDIDFYSAPLSEKDPDLPPSTGWTKSSEGLNPAPQVTVQPNFQPQSGGEVSDPGVQVYEDSEHRPQYNL